MAGIGFELRRLLLQQSYAGLLRAYGYAGLISGGPWLISILAILALGGLAGVPGRAAPGAAFQVCVTYLLMGSLVLSGPMQLLFCRFAADRLYEERPARIAPNLLGALLLLSAAAGTLGLLLLPAFPAAPPALRPLLLAAFVLLTDLWLVVVLLSGLKAYRAVVGGFAAGYGVTLLVGWLLRGAGLTGLLCAFVIGQALLFFHLLAQVLRALPRPPEGALSPRFDFLRRGEAFPSLAAVGLFYNLGVWIDKLAFWYNPATSSPALGPLRTSLIYDIPLSLAYLSSLPGMAVFLVRIETDFAEEHRAFYRAVREGGTLAEIERRKDAMVRAVRQGIYDIFKVQGVTLVLLLLGGPRLLRALSISPLHLHLLYVDAAAVCVQVLLLSILNVLFYLDQRRLALLLTALLCGANLVLSLLTQALGPSFYGYGYAGALLLCSLLGLALLSRKLDRLEFETFMLQSASASPGRGDATPTPTPGR